MWERCRGFMNSLPYLTDWIWRQLYVEGLETVVGSRWLIPKSTPDHFTRSNRHSSWGFNGFTCDLGCDCYRNPSNEGFKQRNVSQWFCGPLPLSGMADSYVVYVKEKVTVEPLHCGERWWTRLIQVRVKSFVMCTGIEQGNDSANITLTRCSHS